MPDLETIARAARIIADIQRSMAALASIEAAAKVARESGQPQKATAFTGCVVMVQPPAAPPAPASTDNLPSATE